MFRNQILCSNNTCTLVCQKMPVQISISTLQIHSQPLKLTRFILSSKPAPNPVFPSHRYKSTACTTTTLNSLSRLHRKRSLATANGSRQVTAPPFLLRKRTKVSFSSSRPKAFTKKKLGLRPWWWLKEILR